ncbi:hypothetical protein ACVXG7_30335 [Enterobacter hormaechei]
MLSFHAHAQTSTCRTTRDQWVVQVPYAIGYAPGTSDWTPISAPIQSTGADFYSCDGGMKPGVVSALSTWITPSAPWWGRRRVTSRL